MTFLGIPGITPPPKEKGLWVYRPSDDVWIKVDRPTENQNPENLCTVVDMKEIVMENPGSKKEYHHKKSYIEIDGVKHPCTTRLANRFREGGFDGYLIDHFAEHVRSGEFLRRTKHAGKKTNKEAIDLLSTVESLKLKETE